MTFVKGKDQSVPYRAVLPDPFVNVTEQEEVASDVRDIVPFIVAPSVTEPVLGEIEITALLLLPPPPPPLTAIPTTATPKPIANGLS